MEILFATTNPAKIRNYKDRLEKHGINVLTLRDLNLNVDVEENGKNAIENACIKAETYGKLANKITIGMDSNLFFENLPENKQPGTHVRRVNGKTLSDEEMIEYYKNLANEYGGRIAAKWVTGVAIYNGKETKTYSFSKSKFYLVNKESSKRRQGYPLDSISIAPQFNKYVIDLNDEERQTREENINEHSHESVIDNICDILKKFQES